MSEPAGRLRQRRQRHPDPTASPAAESTPPAAESEAANEPGELTGTLKVSGWDMEVSGSLFKAVIDAFTAAHPGVTTEAIDIPAADYGSRTPTPFIPSPAAAR